MTPTKRLEKWFERALKQNTVVDLRALALLRMALGLLVLVDLWIRKDDIAALYSDAGTTPRDALERPAMLVLYFLRGDPTWVGALFVVTAAAAVWLISGYRGRLAAIVCWFFVGSLQQRNTIIAQAGDDLLRMMMLWCALAPSGARWSLGGKPSSATRTRGAATTVLYGQLMLLYFITGTAKARLAPWWQGDGVYYALSADYITTGAGQWIYPHARVLQVLTYATLALELTGPYLLLLGPPRPWFRVGLCASFVLMHIGIAATLAVGLFSYISIASWLFVLPTEVMDRIERLLGRVPEARRIMLRESQLVRRVATTLFVYLIIATSIEDKLGDTPLKQAALFPARVLDFKLLWLLFVSHRADTGWPVIEGKLADGSTVDLLRGGAPVDWQRPAVVSEIFPNYRWRKMLINMIEPERAADAERYLAWQCRQRADLREVSYVFVAHRIGESYQHGEPEQRRLYRHVCD